MVGTTRTRIHECTVHYVQLFQVHSLTDFDQCSEDTCTDKTKDTAGKHIT